MDIAIGRRAEPPLGALALLDVAGVAPGVPRALAGRYRLVRPLAKGGMAEVWEGRDEVLSRPVAVKMLLSHLAADPHLRERFRREAVTAARLVHPGIVATFDAGVTPLGETGAGIGVALGRRLVERRKRRPGRVLAGTVKHCVHRDGTGARRDAQGFDRPGLPPPG